MSLLNEQWAPLAVYGKRAPLGGKLRGQPNPMKTNSRICQTAHTRPQLEPVSLSQLVLVLDLQRRLLLPPAVTSNGAAFLQLSTTSSEEGCWLNLQIQRSRRMVYANIATIADWLTPVLDLLRASRHQRHTNLIPRCVGSIRSRAAQV